MSNIAGSGSGGGADREWLRPLTPDGHRDTDNPDLDNIVGCHTGKFFGFNLRNPQPNYEYIWENFDRDDIQRVRYEGGQLVRRGDPESPVQDYLEDMGGDALAPTRLDSLVVHRGCVLVRYPVEVIRQRRAEERATARAMMRGGADEYAQRITDAETQLSRGLPTRFRRKDHRLDYMNHQDQVVNQEIPEVLPES